MGENEGGHVKLVNGRLVRCPGTMEKQPDGSSRCSTCGHVVGRRPILEGP